MGFVDSGGIPTKLYHEFRSEGVPSVCIATGLKNAYREIFTRNVNAHDASDDEIKGYALSISGKSYF